jgi:uncharacterized protein
VKVVSNASALISLSASGRLGLLLERFPDGVVIPGAVWREVVLEGRGRAGATEVAEASWIRVREASPGTALRLLLAELDDGEAESLALASEIGADLVLLDEREARGVARSMGLTVLGTVGILLWAKRMGRVASLRKELDALQDKGAFRLSASLVERLLREAGEA